MKVELTTLLIIFSAASLVSGGCYVNRNITSPYVWKVNPVKGPLPGNFHWGNVNGTNFLTQLKNQHLPQYCGSCWAQAATSALSDRISVMRNGVFPEINISPQVLLSCDRNDQGCQGGDTLSAYQWMNQNVITEENCAPYQALSWKEGLQCNATAICAENFPNKPPFVPAKYNTYQVGEYALLPRYNTSAMMNEIFARGPIACSIFSNPIVNFTGTGVFASNVSGEHNHAISVVGWGTTSDGTPYWSVRNSWGEYWGDNGYIKIYRGNNTIQIESNCVYGVPIVTWQNQTYPHSAPNQPRNDTQQANEVQEPASFARACVLNRNKTVKSVVTMPLPQDTIDIAAVPDSLFWGNISDVNYLSWHVNQHLPQYCGSCWAQAGAASLADRIHILKNNQFPRVALSVQVLLNCYAEGSCGGGWGDGPYEFAHLHGIPEFGCQVYEAKDPKFFECSPMQQCKNCKLNPDGSQNCWAVTNFTRWYVSDHGSLRGASNMKKEIFARGPISCGMYATNKFEQTYTGGIYSEATAAPFPNHYVSVVGWGKDPSTNVEYWIVRNSWGTHFGENGFFRIKIGADALGIGTYDCFWGVPSTTKVSQMPSVATS